MKRRDSKRNRNKKNTTNKENIIFIKSKKILMMIITLILIMFFSTIFALIHSVSNKTLSRIKINGTEVSNLTIDEAYQTLNETLKNNISKNIIVKDEEYEVEINLEQLEVTYKTEEALNKAYKIGRDRNILKSNYEIVANIIFGNNIEEKITYNEEQLNKTIEDIEVKIPDKQTNNAYYIEGNELIITKGKKGKTLKKQELKEKLIDAIKKQVYGIEVNKISLPIEIQEPEMISIEQIYNEIKKEPKDAYYEENPLVIHKEEDGVELAITIEEAEKILQEQQAEYIIPLKITKPKITILELAKNKIFPDNLSKYTTRYDETNTNRSTNIKLSTEKINGKILMPGEIFSYNKIVGERTIKAGYKEAAVYMGGKVVNGIGGGICQVSSTLYNAILQANLEIVARKNHYFITSYVSPSRDATVAYGSIDFQFKNNRTYPIKIESSAKNGICQILIKGIKEEIEYNVEIQDEVTQIIPYSTKYIDTNDLEKGQEEEIQKGINGYKSEAYRILTLNGKIISKTLLSKDSYNPLQRVIKRGTR